MTSIYGSDPSQDFTFSCDFDNSRSCYPKELSPHKCSILDIIKNNPNFSIFYTLVKRANLEHYFNDCLTYTVFVPSDDCIPCHEFINSLDIGRARQIVLYHTLDKYVPSKIIYVNKHLQIPTKNGESIITKVDDDGGIIINSQAVHFRNNMLVSVYQSQVIEEDIWALNGVVHVIDNMLLPSKIN